MSSRKRRRTVTVVSDTPEASKGNFTIVEDSVFDTSQVPDTAERSRTFIGVKAAGHGQNAHPPRRLKDLPSFLPGEQTFVSQSQQVALSSTVLSASSSRSRPNMNTSRSRGTAADRRKSRRSNIDPNEFLSFILDKEKSPRGSASSLHSGSDSVGGEDGSSSDEDNEWDKLTSVHGSVQKYLPKPLGGSRKSVVDTDGAKSRTNARTSAPKSQERRKVVKNLSDDLRRKSLANQTIEELAEVDSSIRSVSSLSNVDPKLLVKSFQNFSTDSAKAIIAKMEAGEYRSGSERSLSVGEKSANGSRKSSDVPRISRGGSNPLEGTKTKVSMEKTSLSPVPMDVVTPAPARVLRSVGSEEETPSRTTETQKPPVLDGVTVFVDFRGTKGHDNLSDVIAKKAKDLGASSASKLGAGVTHVIFKDGTLANYNRAKKMGVQIVGSTWLDSCEKAGRRVAEAEHPSVSRDKYESPGLFPKLRKMKSMQPKTLEEDFAAATKSRDRKNKVQAKKKLLEEEENNMSAGEKIKRPPHNHYYKGCEKFYNRTTKENNSSLKDLLQKIHSPGGGSTPLKLAPINEKSSPVSPSSNDIDTPLAERLARRYMSPLTNESSLRSRSLEASSLSATPVRPARDFTEKEAEVFEDSHAKEGTRDGETTTAGGKIQPEPTVDAAAAPPQKKVSAPVSNKRGRKRKPAESPAAAKPGNVTANLGRRSPLRDVSNSSKPPRTRHKLFPQSSTQLLDETVDKTDATPMPRSIEVENVHVTAKKKVAEKSTNPQTSQNPSKAVKKVTKVQEDKNSNEITKKSKSKLLKNRRRTSVDFLKPQSFSQSQSSLNSSKGRSKLCGFVALTSCLKEDKDLVKDLTKRYGVLGFHDTISEKTTHVVCGANKRTINLVKGMVLGCWILSKDWVMASVEAGMWLEEEKFEMTSFSDAVREVREERQVFKSFKSRLFSDVGPVYISSKCRVSRADLRQVVVWGGGSVVNTARVAAVVVGEFCHVGDSSTPHFVSDTWILDSVQHNVVKPFLDYPL